MAEQRKRLNFLLVSATSGSINVVTGALERSGTRCRLMMVKPGPSTLQYLRREGRYAEAPAPELIFFDAVGLDSAGTSLLGKMKADPQIRTTPIVLLTNDESLEALERLAPGKDDYTAFSPVELDSFLNALNAIKTRRFMDAISLLENFGFVLVRMPESSDDSAARPSSGAGGDTTRDDFMRSA